MIGLRNLFGIGSVTLADDSGEMQLLQITERSAGKGIADRVMDKIRRVAEFGFASVPPLGSEALVARRGGERIQSMVIGTSHRPSRPRGLQPGDTCLYDVRGQRIWMSAAGLVVDAAGLPIAVHNCPTVTVTATEKVVLDAPEVDMTGNLNVAGTIVAQGEIEAIAGEAKLSVVRNAYVGHQHGSVAAGTASTAGPSLPA